MARLTNTTFTSESVCSGHPDKLCDQVSDSILDAILTKDSHGRVAVETLATANRLIIAGEVTTSALIDFKKITQEQIKRLGYIHPEFNFSHKSQIDVYIHQQSPEIASGVQSKNKNPKGAGDQGMMFGFACKQTPEFMPLPIHLAHKLAMRIDKVRENGLIPHLRPDGKTQVTVKYKEGKPVAVTNAVIAVPHSEDITLNEMKNALYKHVLVPVLSDYGFRLSIKNLVVNGTGIWHRGGPASDTGLTGRKIVVDTYGGYARVGGGCFSGKDPTKVDRSGAYAARFIAKNIVAHNLADIAEVRLAYFIGAKRPIMQEVETFGTQKVSAKAISDFTNKLISTSVSGIIEELDLLRPIYLPTASYGHFGRDEFPWEEIKNI